MCALGAGVALICTGFGMVFGSVAVVQGIAVLGLTTAVIGTGGAAMIQAAMKVSDFRQALSSLKKIRACLLEIAAEQSSLKGKHANLCTPGDRSAEGEKVIIDDARQELTDILNKTQTQVTEGFKILKKF